MSTIQTLIAARELLSEPTEAESLRARVAELEALINTPQTVDWFDGVQLEAAHQQERWGTTHDGGKTAFDWFWLIGYLAQKAASSAVSGNVEKAKHHTISTGAALLNWHRNLSGENTSMRPGTGDAATPRPDPKEDFRHVAKLLREPSNQASLWARLSNNLNVIIAALDAAGRDAT